MPGGAAMPRRSSVTVSRWPSGDSPSMSGQYSSKTASAGAVRSSVTLCLTTPDNASSTSGSSLVTVAPSGSVMRTDGSSRAVSGGSVSVAWHWNRFGQRFGFFALATLPVSASTSAYARSPSRPCSVTAEASSSSPIIDLTG